MSEAAATWHCSATEIRHAVAGGRWSAAGVVEDHLARLEAVDTALGAFVAVDPEGARRDAERLDEQHRAGEPPGPLHGVPVAVKDCLDVAGMPTRMGSEAFAGARPEERDSEAVRRLRVAGALVLGKTTMHELSAGVTTPGTTNPWDAARPAGGSSGGSAVAVAAHLAPVALGTDTLGSVRVPAALCGVAGLKPTYGAVPARGLRPLAWSLDTVGGLARTVADLTLLHGVLAPGPPAPAPAARTVGVLQDLLAGADAGARGALERALDALRGAGLAVRPVRLPELEFALPAAQALLMAEAAATYRTLLRDRGEHSGSEVRELLEAGIRLPAWAYLASRQARQELSAAMRRLFEHHDLLALCAPAPSHAPEPGAAGDRPEPPVLASMRRTAVFNLTGQPVLAVPVMLDERGLPQAVQIAARPGDDATALRVGEIVEAAAGEVARRRAAIARALP